MREVGNVAFQILSHYYTTSGTQPSQGNVDVNTSILTFLDETKILVADFDAQLGHVLLKQPDHGKCIFIY